MEGVVWLLSLGFVALVVDITYVRRDIKLLNRYLLELSDKVNNEQK